MDSLKPNERALRAELERAVRQHKEVNLEFWRISCDIPSGLPHPDGVQRLQNAAQAQVRAMRNEYLALKRLNAWLAGERSMPQEDDPK